MRRCNVEWRLCCRYAAVFKKLKKIEYHGYLLFPFSFQPNTCKQKTFNRTILWLDSERVGRPAGPRLGVDAVHGDAEQDAVLEDDRSHRQREEETQRRRVVEPAQVSRVPRSAGPIERDQ